MNHKYRLKRQFRSHKVHELWQTCNDEDKKRLERMFRNRYEFKVHVKAVAPPKAIETTDNSKKEAK